MSLKKIEVFYSGANDLFKIREIAVKNNIQILDTLESICDCGYAHIKICPYKNRNGMLIFSECRFPEYDTTFIFDLEKTINQALLKYRLPTGYFFGQLNQNAHKKLDNISFYDETDIDDLSIAYLFYTTRVMKISEFLVVQNFDEYFNRIFRDINTKFRPDDVKYHIIKNYYTLSEVA